MLNDSPPEQWRRGGRVYFAGATDFFEIEVEVLLRLNLKQPGGQRLSM